MKQTDTGHYDVVQGEKVTLTIVANKINEDVAVSLDGSTLNPTSSAPLVYKFSITKSAGAQFVDIQCHFTAADPSDGFYQFFVQGDKSGGRFNASSIRKSDSDWEAILQFTLP